MSGAIGAVEADGEEPRMRYRGVESLDGLSREGAAAGVGQRARDHDGDCASELCGQRVDGVEGGLGVERVEDRLDEQHVGPDPAAQGGMGQHRRGDALDLVGALFVVDDPPAVGPENGCNHLHGGGFSVGAGQADDGEGKL